MGSHADDIVGDYFETADWDALDDEDGRPEPELELPPIPSAPPSQ